MYENVSLHWYWCQTGRTIFLHVISMGVILSRNCTKISSSILGNYISQDFPKNQYNAVCIFGLTNHNTVTNDDSINKRHHHCNSAFLSWANTESKTYPKFQMIQTCGYCIRSSMKSGKHRTYDHIDSIVSRNCLLWKLVDLQVLMGVHSLIRGRRVKWLWRFPDSKITIILYDLSALSSTMSLPSNKIIR